MKITTADLKDLLALTLWPEWAYAFLHFGKDIENRTWRPHHQMLRRWHGIHGGQAIGGMPARGERYYDETHGEAVRSMLEMAKLNGAVINEKITIRKILNCRGIVAIGYLDEARQPPKDRDRWHVPFTLDAHGIKKPCFGLHFSKIMPLPEPIPCKGALGFWRVPEPARTMIQNSVL